jgi:hypothetical protein
VPVLQLRQVQLVQVLLLQLLVLVEHHRVVHLQLERRQR